MTSYNQLFIFFILAILLTIVTYTLLKYIYKHTKRIGVYLWGYRVQQGVIIHAHTLKHIKTLERKIAAEQQRIAWLQQNRIKTERDGQMRFELDAPRRNGAHSAIPWNILNPDTGTMDMYHLVFNNTIDRIRFLSDDYLWVEHRTDKVGKRQGPLYKNMWVHVDEFNAHTDIDILKYWPYVDKKQKNMIDDKYLPFTIVEPEYS